MKFFQKPFFSLFLALFLIISAFFTATFPMEAEYAIISSVMVVLFAVPCYVGLQRTLGTRVSLHLITLMSIFALILENFAVITSFPYGGFSYGGVMGARIFEVPWTVGFAWTPILFGCVSLVRNHWHSAILWQRVLAVALAMTAFDFVLDPAAVSLGFWTWEYPFGFYQVPWSNFFGWILSSAVAAGIVEAFLRHKKLESLEFSPLTHSSLIGMLVFWTSVCAFQALWIPAIIGGVLLVGVVSQDRQN